MSDEMKPQNFTQISADDRRYVSDHNEYFNAQFGAKPYYLAPGESGCGNAPEEMLIATIGAGIAVSIYDKDLQIGGMANILVPDSVIDLFPRFDMVEPSVLQKIFKPLDDCIAVLKQMGAGKTRIRVRVIGGSSYHGDKKDRGTKNYIIVKSYLNSLDLMPMSEDVSGAYLRRVHFFPSTGHAVRRVLRRKDDYASMQETEYQYQLNF